MSGDEIARAVRSAPRSKLAEMAGVVWRAFAAGVLVEAEAQRLAEEIEARKAVLITVGKNDSARRHVGSRPRSSASLERRRRWTASGWLPPATAARFTMGEQAVLGVVLAEIATQGRCELAVGAVAGRAGVCATTVRNAVRMARSSGLLHVEDRRVAYDRSLPNVLTIASRELALWVRTRARIERKGGGCKTAAPTTNHNFSSAAQPAPAARKVGNRWGKAPRRSYGETALGETAAGR